MKVRIPYLVMSLAIALIAIAPIVSAQDQAYTTTEDFESGIKSSSDGNFEVETQIDNGKTVVGGFELGSLKGDSFNFIDENADTFKWNRQDRNAVCPVFAIGSGFVTIEGSSDSTHECVITTSDTYSGDIDIRVRMRTPVDGQNRAMSICLYNEGVDGCNNILPISTTVDGIWYRNLVDTILSAFTVTNGVATEVGISSTPCGEPIWLRVTRVSTTVTFYSSCNGSAWTQDETTTFTTSSSLYLMLSLVTNGPIDGFGEFSSLDIFAGTVDPGGWRTTGNWKSQTVVLPDSKRIDRVVVTYSGASASNFITRAEFILNGAVDQEFEEDRTSGTSVTYFATSVLSGPANFNFKIFLVGAGSGSTVIESIEVFYHTIIAIEDEELTLIWFLLALWIILSFAGFTRVTPFLIFAAAIGIELAYATFLTFQGTGGIDVIAPLVIVSCAIVELAFAMDKFMEFRRT